MITLYIKTHRKTGLKYFGKTMRDDPISYKGSGKYWLRHLMKHGFDFDTEIYLQSEDIDYVIQEALRFSRAYDIVNSPLWANLVEENGLDGQPKGILFTDEWREKLSKKRKGIPNKHHSIKISKSWLVINPAGEERIVVNLKQFCKENSLDQGHMGKVSFGKRKQHKGWTCKKFEEKY